MDDPELEREVEDALGGHIINDLSDVSIVSGIRVHSGELYQEETYCNYHQIVHPARSQLTIVSEFVCEDGEIKRFLIPHNSHPYLVVTSGNLATAFKDRIKDVDD